MSTKIDDKRLSFLDLPPEIRNRIYRAGLTSPHQPIQSKPRTPFEQSRFHAFRGYGPPITEQLFHTTFRKKIGPPGIRRLRLQPRLLQLCKHVHREATPVLYGSNRFHLSRFNLSAFMIRIGPKSVTYLRDLQLDYYARWGLLQELRSTLKELMNAGSLQRLRVDIRGFTRWKPKSVASALGPLMEVLHMRAKCGKGKDAMQVLECFVGFGPPNQVVVLRHFDNEVRQLLQARLERKKTTPRRSKWTYSYE